LALTLVEREELSRSLAAGHSIRSIAGLLRRAPSTISREINRNGGHEGYRASQADQAAWDRAHRPKNGKLVDNQQTLLLNQRNHYCLNFTETPVSKCLNNGFL
jgi:IS30 family transposase